MTKDRTALAKRWELAEVLIFVERGASDHLGNDHESKSSLVAEF